MASRYAERNAGDSELFVAGFHRVCLCRGPRGRDTILPCRLRNEGGPRLASATVRSAVMNGSATAPSSRPHTSQEAQNHARALCLTSPIWRGKAHQSECRIRRYPRGHGIERGEVRTRIATIAARRLVPALRRKPVVAVRSIDETDVAHRGWKEVAIRIRRLGGADDDVMRDHRMRQVVSDSALSFPDATAYDPVLAPLDDVVADRHERFLENVEHQQRRRRKTRVVLEGDVTGIVDELPEASQIAERGRADLGKEIVLHQNPTRSLGAIRRGHRHREPTRSIQYFVVAERHVASDGPGCAPALIDGHKHDGEAVLSAGPIVLENVAFHEHALRVLQLEQILHQPTATPLQRLCDVIAPDHDVGRYESVDARVAAAEHHVLTRSFEVVSDDFERPWPVPSNDGLAV